MIPAEADVGRAVFHSSCVTSAGGVVTDLLWHLLIHTHCCCWAFRVAMDWLDRTSSLLSICAKGKGNRKEAWNPPSSSSISNSSYRPEAWRLNGGGEKGLNEQSERYLQLPPLTQETTAAIGRHPWAGTTLFISARWPTVRGNQALANGSKAICVFLNCKRT